MRYRLLLAVVTACTLSPTHTAGAQNGIRWLETEDSWHYRAYGMPDFDQVRADGVHVDGLPGTGKLHCVPTSSVNAIAWLAHIHAPDLVPGDHPWHEYTGVAANPTYVDRYNDITAAINSMANLMFTDPGSGTKLKSVDRGLALYLLAGGGSHIGYEVFDDGIEVRGGLHAPSAASVTLYEVSRMLSVGAVGILHWGWYRLSEDDGTYYHVSRNGGHTTTIVMFSRMGDELSFVVRNPGRTGDSETRQSRFTLEHYAVETIEVTWSNPIGPDVTFTRQALLPRGRTVAGSLDRIAIIDRFTLLRPTWALNAYVNRVDIVPTSVGEASSPLTYEAPAGQVFTDAELSPDQLAAVVASRANDGPHGSLLTFDIASGVVDVFAEVTGLRELVMTRFGTVVTLENGGHVRHLTFADDASESFISAVDYEDDATQVDVDDDTDRLWLFDPQGALVSYALPELEAREDVLLGDVAPWELVTDFRIDPSASSSLWWFVVDGELLQVLEDPSGKGPLQYVWYTTPMPAESLVVNGFGDVIVTMSDGIDRAAATFTPDADAGTLARVDSPFDGLDVGFAFKPTRNRSTFPSDLDEEPAYQLDVTEIQDWFAPEEPGEAGLTCGPVDDFEDLQEDGAPVSMRTLNGVEIAISTATDVPLYARTYGEEGARAFAGALTHQDRPSSPLEVSGERFLSGSGGAEPELFNLHQPITFAFDRPVSGFGLTTIDLLDDAVDADADIALRAFDADGNELAAHVRQGPQGASGVVLRWFVEVDGADIATVRLGGTIAAGGGYGLDDLELCRPTCAADLDGDGTVGVGDLLAVLANWGGPGGDVTGDGITDITDLLDVLGAWGTCS